MSNEVINPYQTFRDDNGNVLADGTITFYTNTTITLDTIFSDEALTTSQSNPYTLDAYGRIAGDVKYSGKKTLLIKTASGGHVRTLDNVSTSIDGSKSVIPHDTLSDAVADTTLEDGDALNIAERTTGNGGGAMWDAVLSSTVTENTYDIVQCTGVATLSLVLRTKGRAVDASAFGLVADWNGTAGTDNTPAYKNFIDRAQAREFSSFNFSGTDGDFYFAPISGKTTCIFLSTDTDDWQANPNPIYIGGDATIVIDSNGANNVWMSGPDGDNIAETTNDVNIIGSLKIISSVVNRTTYDHPATTMTNFAIGFNVSKWRRSDFTFRNEFAKGIVQAPLVDGLYDSTSTFAQQVRVIKCVSTHAQENFLEFTQAWGCDAIENTIERGNGGMKCRRSSGQAWYRSRVQGNLFQANAKTRPFDCNFGVAFNFTDNYFESNRGTSGEAVEAVFMAPNAVLDLNSLVFEGNFFAQQASSLDLVGAVFAHVILDGFHNFFPKGNDFTGGNGYKLTNSTGKIYSEGETYTAQGSIYSEGDIAIAGSSIVGVKVSGKAFEDSDSITNIQAARMQDDNIGAIYTESFRITSGASHDFSKYSRGIVAISCAFTPDSQIIISIADNGTAPLHMAVTASTLFDMQTTPALPASGRIGVATNAGDDGFTITSNLTTDRDFQVTYLSAGTFSKP